MKIFKWDDFSEWEPAVRGLMGIYLDDAVIAEFKNGLPDYVVSDDLGWLNSIVGTVHGIRMPDSSRLLTKKLLEHYTHVTCFHGCRAESTETYSTHGLVACDPDNMAALALEIFGDTERVRRSINELKATPTDASYEDHNRGKVFFTLTKDELVEYCGHYLLYGSEYLHSVASGIGGEQKLRKRGRATIIECNVPMDRIGRAIVTELAGNILQEIFSRVLDPEGPPEHNGFAFAVRGSLPPENIAAFHFPTQIPNPHNGGRLED